MSSALRARNEIGGPVHLARLEAREIVRAAFPRSLVRQADAPLWERGGCPHDLYDATGNECVRCRLCYHRRVLREDVGATREIQSCEWCGEERQPFRRRGGDPNDIEHDPYAYDGF